MKARYRIFYMNMCLQHIFNDVDRQGLYLLKERNGYSCLTDRRKTNAEIAGEFFYEGYVRNQLVEIREAWSTKQ